MADATKIEWTDSTFNPWTGCTKVSPGCDGCYAEAWSKRAGEKVGKWGPGAPRVRTTPANWAKPLKWNDTPFHECPVCGWRGDGGADEVACPSIDCSGKLVPARRRVFCASLADVFDNEVPAEWRADLFELIAATPNLDWLLLTKRIGNAKRMMDEVACNPNSAAGPCTEWQPMPNVSLGATIVNQEEADRDIPKLLATPARLRFLSMEPLLGPVDLARIDLDGHSEIFPLTGTTDCEDEDGDPAPDLPAIDWVIVGGESGPKARPMHPDWVRSLRDQCAAARVPFLFKQWGENVCDQIDPAVRRDHVCAINTDGRDWALCKPETDGWWALPPDAATWREIGTPPPGVVEVRRVGKKAAGRLLDGVEHNGFPNP